MEARPPQDLRPLKQQQVFIKLTTLTVKQVKDLDGLEKPAFPSQNKDLSHSK